MRKNLRLNDTLPGADLTSELDKCQRTLQPHTVRYDSHTTCTWGWQSLRLGHKEDHDAASVGVHCRPLRFVRFTWCPPVKGTLVSSQLP
jgi:hypothetical protein